MNRKTRKLLLIAVKLAIAAGLLVVVLQQVHWNDTVGVDDDGNDVTLPGFRTSLTSANVALVVAGFATFGLSQIAIAIRWRLLLKVQDIDLTMVEALRLTFLGLFFNNTVPGTVGGDLFKAYYAAKHTHRKAAAVVAVLIDRVVGLTMLASLAATTLLAVWGFRLTPGDQLGRPALIVAIVLGGLVLGLAFLLSRRFRRVLGLQAIYKRLPLAHHLAAAGEATGRYKHQLGKVLQAMGLSVFAHSCLIVGIFLLGRSLGLGIPWFSYFLFVPLIYTIGAIPITPGGLGIIEQLYLLFFAANDSKLLVLALLARFMPIVCGLPGLWVFLTGPRPPKADDIQHELELEEQAEAGGQPL
ncbi:MAG: lysylphosphatidylglycerol synthase transmembrane domain-containing protein [Planctomycetota bacterium]